MLYNYYTLFIKQTGETLVYVPHYILLAQAKCYCYMKMVYRNVP